MVHKNISIDFLQYSSIDELPSDEKILLENAIFASRGAYAPYSKFLVGAAVRLSSGEIIKGANQENAAYPSGLCAERTAIFSAHANYPTEDIVAIAITAVVSDGNAILADDCDLKMLPDPTYPCGSCLQVLVESQMRSGKPIKVIIGGERSIQVFSDVKCLLPFAFNNLS